MEVRSILSLYLFFLTMVIPVSARTCQERLDVLEDVVQSLIESQKAKLTDNDDPNQRAEEAFRNPKLEKERHGLEQRLEDLEKTLARANNRIKELETRVSEFESSEILMNARPPTDYGRKNNLLTGLGKTKSKMEHSRPGKVDPVKQRNFIKNITDELQSNFSMTGGQIMNSAENLRTPKGKRLLTGIQPTTTPSTGSAAFSAYVSVYETDISKDHTIKFDTIVTNIGNHYNQHSGMFTAPEHGVYVFSWNIYCGSGGYIYSQLVVNSNVAGAMFTSAQGAGNIRSTTGVVVVQVNAGDVVYVRIHPTNGHLHNLFSQPDWRSSFSGWKLY